MNKHVATDHDNKKLLKYKCDRCQLSFTKTSKLKHHIETVHENKKPFKCDVCEHPFARNPFVILTLKKKMVWKNMLQQFMKRKTPN